MYSFPVTRRIAARIYSNPVGAGLMLVAALWLVQLPYVLLRNTADRWLPANDGAAIERNIFGELPTVWLQDALYSGGYNWFEHLTVYIHASWFIIPPAVTLLIAFRHRGQFVSYATAHALVMYLSVLCFMLMPMQPPWMADDAVTRVLTLRFGDEAAIDGNLVAAMPSLHVALPLTIALWALGNGHQRLAAFMAAYSALIGFEVVFMGEHYVIDLAGALAVSLAAVGIGRWVDRRAWRDISPPFKTSRTPALQTVRASERGQNLIEFALLSPLIILLIGAIVVGGLAFTTRSGLQQGVL